MDVKQQQNKPYRLSVVSFKETMNIVRSFIDDKDRIDILNFIEKSEKDKLFLLNDNLINTERTDWKYHQNRDFRPYYNILLKELFECVIQYDTLYGGGLKIRKDYDIERSIFMMDSWFAKSRKNAFVEPHNHGHGYAFFSFVCYLKLPSLKSSLKFASSDLSWQENLLVREGDIIVFPSHLPHWTNDVEEGRSIYSGNFIFQTSYACKCESCEQERLLDKEVF